MIDENSIVRIETRVSTERSDNNTCYFNPRCQARVRAEIETCVVITVNARTRALIARHVNDDFETRNRVSEY
jgi:predicted RecB family nuclease